jgi:hypothetical protein
MRRGKRVAHTRRRERYIAFWLGNLKEGDNLETLGAHVIIIIIIIIIFVK